MPAELTTLEMFTVALGLATVTASLLLALVAFYVASRVFR